MSVPITRDGPYAAPYAYQLAASESWQALTISATFDGTSASGSFYPCCSIYTQDGKLVSRDFPSASVAAGASAEVTYHPFLRTSTSGSVSTGAAPNVATFYRSAQVKGDPPQTVAGGSTDNLTWPNVALPSDGSITGPVIGDAFVSFNVDCITLEYLFVQWESATFPRAGVLGTQSRIINADQYAFDNNGAVGIASDGTSVVWSSQNHPNAHVSTDLLHAYVTNGDSSSHDVEEAWLVIYAWPITGYNGAIPGWPQ